MYLLICKLSYFIIHLMLLLCSTTFQNQYTVHFQDEICFIISIYISFTSQFWPNPVKAWPEKACCAVEQSLLMWCRWQDVKNKNKYILKSHFYCRHAGSLDDSPGKPKSLAGCLQKCSFSHREANHWSPFQGHHVWMLSPPLRAKLSYIHLPVASS